MAKDLVLLTGATGFIGFRILRYAIEQTTMYAVQYAPQAKPTPFATMQPSSQLQTTLQT